MVTKILLRVVVTAVVLLIAALVSRIVTAHLRRRAKALDTDGCVACGAKEVVVDGGTLRCRRCGYVGRADGGGTLSVDELRSIHAPEDRH